MSAMLNPKVITTICDKEKTFVFRVHAYRRLSEAEMRQAIAVWLHQSHRKTIPSNTTINVKTIHGFDE